MDKRGTQLTIETIIIAILAIVVLIILIMVLRTAIGKSVAQYLGFGEQAAQEANASNVKCSSFFAQRVCAKAVPNNDYYWNNLGKADCKDGTCYERGDPRAK